MKKSLFIIFCFSLMFAFGCSKPDSSEVTSGYAEESTDSIDVIPNRTEEWMEGLESENGTYPITLPLDPEVSQSLYEASVSEEESLNEEAARWDAVDEVINSVTSTKEFLEADDDKKAEMVICAMKELSEHGTEKYPESLIIYDSWVYYPEYQEVDAQYFDGVSFVVSWYDFNAASTAATN